MSMQGGNSWGGGGGGGRGAPSPNFWPTTLFGFFSHTTDRSGVKLGQSYMIMSDKTAIFQQ